MVFRLTQKLAKKIKKTPKSSCPVGSNPYADWSAHLFRAGRTQYIIVSNTTSLYSLVYYGSGITDLSTFLDYTIHYMADYMQKDGFEFQFRRFIAPQTTVSTICKLNDRRVIGSINNLIYIAKFYLIERQVSPFNASQQINQTSFSYLGYRYPRDAFAQMKPVL